MMIQYDFCKDWLFTKEDMEAVPVTLPHDAMQTEGRKPEAPSGTGCAFFPGGKYVYEKTFIAPADWQNKTVVLAFDGVYPSAEVFLNGEKAGCCAYGYLPFQVALTRLRYGEQNILRVLVDNTQVPNSRWYSGAGIYRPVNLLIMPEQHILPDGIRVTTLSVEPARIRVETRMNENATFISVQILDQGHIIAEGSGTICELDIPDAALWSTEHPHLYECRVRTGEDEQIVSFGIRTLSWNTQGFFVNGQPVKLKGGCIHHDHGVLGSRDYLEADERRIRKLKEFGFNAIRCAHHPASSALLDACDRLGMYVMDEGWDMWTKPKNPYDYANRFLEHYKSDIRAITSRDYNHPSVVMYSIGNELTEPSKPEGVALAQRLVDCFRGNDPTRPVTAGMNLTILLMASMGIDLTVSAPQDETEPSQMEAGSTAFNQMVSERGTQMTMAAATDEADRISSPVLDLLDIAGYNYASSRYALDGEKHPDRLIVGSETYPQDLAENWAMVEKLPYLIGDFMWTAWDYLGEVGLGAWNYEEDGATFAKAYPWLLADAGAFDILGNDNAEAGLARSVWKKDAPPYIAAIPVNRDPARLNTAIWRGSNALPYWSWPGCEGKPATVEVYSGAASVELLLNGKSFGRKETIGHKAVFEAVYEPGELRAIAYDADGQAQGQSALRSATGSPRLVITPEPSNDGKLIWLDISLRGDNGEIICSQEAKLTITVTNGELLGFGSANPRTEEDFLSGTYTTWYGRAQAVIQKAADHAIVCAEGDGFSATITL